MLPLENPNRRYFDLGQGGNPVPPQQPRTLGSMAPPPQPGFSPQPQGTDAFSQAISDLLKRYQQLGTRPFKQQEYDATQQQINRTSAQTSADLIGAAPSVQAGVRNASVGALDPTVQGAQASQQTFSEQLNTFGDTVGTARSLLKDYEENQNKARDDARNVIKDAFTIGGADSLKDLAPDEVAALEKAAGYPKGYVQGVGQTLKEREMQIRKEIADQNAALRAAALDGGGGYTKNQLAALTKINENVSGNATYKKTTSMRGYVDNVIGALSQGNGLGDIAAINQFQKVIDEGAVTRDQDVKLVQGAQSLANQLKTKIKKLERGDQLSTEQRQQMRTLVEQLYTTQIQALRKDPYISSKVSEAGLYGITTDDTILGEVLNQAATSPASGGATVTAPNGKTYQFKTQQEADAFRKAAGI